METILLPDKTRWENLCRRPVIRKSDLDNTVREIIESVRSGKDKALLDLSEKYDGRRPASLKVSAEEITAASVLVPEELKKAIMVALANIEKFHEAQVTGEKVIETTAGVRCWRRSIPIEKVGLYIPGGSAPLFSTVLMLGVPARLAGCKEIIMCTPPASDGRINPVILYTAAISGITEIFSIGGAQAIAAMALGTETVPGVYKVFGPGNQFVTKAKELLLEEGISIDIPAGPSEVLVISDTGADPDFIAADLLSQAEHGPDSQVIYLTDSREMIEAVKNSIRNQIRELPRRETAARALENSKLIMLESLDECIRFSNIYAPEHLVINTSDPNLLASRVVNAGSVFLGPFSCESAGDYASGTNHTLPTNGFSRNYSGVSIDSFVKKVTFQEITEEGIKKLGPVIETMAESELLYGHKNAVSIRLTKITNDRY